MTTKMSFDFPFSLPKMFGGQQTLQELNEMWVKEVEVKIKKIKPEIEPVDHECVEYPGGVSSNLVAYTQLPQLWYLIEVLKKTGIFHLEQVGDKIGLIFLGNIIQQFKLFNSGSCNYVCFLYNYFQKVSTRDWPARNAILEKLEKKLPKMVQTRNKAEKSFNKWWREEMLKQIINYRYRWVQLISHSATKLPIPLNSS